MNKKGFTLIELLAVIIILGILMIIAIPSVTKYISDSRKSAYVDTAKEVIGAARNLVNSGELEMYDTDATYYLDVKCIKTENEMKSPYGEFVDLGAYVVVTYNGKGYDYYWTSVDDSGQGIKNIVKYDKLSSEDIESDLTIDNIKTNRTIDGRSKVILITERNQCKKEGAITENLTQIDSVSGGIPTNIVCIPATTLHSAICDKSNGKGCNATIQTGNQITYGTIVSGSPKPGDAYDCKVTQNGDFSERFYYVGSEGDYSILIYYKNSNGQNGVEYSTTNERWHGPRNAYQYLPSTDEWNNSSLITNETKQIVAENGASSVKTEMWVGGPISTNQIDSFTYTDKAARFLTYQEVQAACGSGNVTTNGYLNNCSWLMESLGKYEGQSGANGYWLETPEYFDDSGVYSGSWMTNGESRDLYVKHPNTANVCGVRPVIKIRNEDLG